MGKAAWFSGLILLSLFVCMSNTSPDDVYELCDIMPIGGVEYSYECDLELHSWLSVPLGQLPAMCSYECSHDCLPEDWNDRSHILKRVMECQ